MSDPDLRRLEERTKLIHQVTLDARELIPLLNDLEERLTQYKRSLLLARDILGTYDL